MWISIFVRIVGDPTDRLIIQAVHIYIKVFVVEIPEVFNLLFWIEITPSIRDEQDLIFRSPIRIIIAELVVRDHLQA
ncbi:hypothetical protein BMS3Bbin04_00524 [bacterium BMS3Bbin04]|nr:hypothetical protein BMS3Bbin04_00524 [bacterium BMS3Bbin04]